MDSLDYINQECVSCVNISCDILRKSLAYYLQNNLLTIYGEEWSALLNNEMQTSVEGQLISNLYSPSLFGSDTDVRYLLFAFIDQFKKVLASYNSDDYAYLQAKMIIYYITSYVNLNFSTNLKFAFKLVESINEFMIELGISNEEISIVYNHMFTLFIHNINAYNNLNADSQTGFRRMDSNVDTMQVTTNDHFGAFDSFNYTEYQKKLHFEQMEQLKKVYNGNSFSFGKQFN